MKMTEERVSTLEDRSMEMIESEELEERIFKNEGLRIC